MIGDNYTDTLNQLNSVRARQNKFICINDNMKHPSEKLLVVLEEFYISFFPIVSIFELPEGVSNPTLYVDEYRKLHNSVWYNMTHSAYSWLRRVGLLLNSSIGSIVKKVLLDLAYGIIRYVEPRNTGIPENPYNHIRIGSSSTGSTGGAGSGVGVFSTVMAIVCVLALICFIAIRTYIRFCGRSNNTTSNNNNNGNNDSGNSSGGGSGNRQSRSSLRGRNEGQYLSRTSFSGIRNIDGGSDYSVEDAMHERRESFSGLDNYNHEFDSFDEDEVDDVTTSNTSTNNNKNNSAPQVDWYAYENNNPSTGTDNTIDNTNSNAHHHTENNAENEDNISTATLLAATGEEYLNALLTSVGWSEATTEGEDGQERGDNGE